MKKVAVIFGGMSTEHDVSILSAKSVLKNINTSKYDVFAIFIDKDGIWYEFDTLNFKKQIAIKNICEYIKRFDVIFPVLHGLYGEDGTIQGLLDMMKVPYVGCGVLASSIAMDKVYSKTFFKEAGLNIAEFVYIKKSKEKYIFVNDNFDEEELSIKDITDKISKMLKFPVFVKPSNSGSSVGISKCKNVEELKNGINIASRYDTKILIEQGINGRELECAVLETDDVLASCVGEIITESNFYDYDLKYKNTKAKIETRASISKDISDEIKRLSIKAFKSIDAKGLSRVDFFLDKENKIYINEINTMPGFTNMSMYPKLFENSGIPYKELISKLIESASFKQN